MINFVSFGTDNCEELLEYFYKSLVDKFCDCSFARSNNAEAYRLAMS